MRVAAYVRVSTSRQVRLETIEQQLEKVSEHAEEQAWELPEENIFRDDGYSGTTLKRPALDALRDKARLREFEIIVVLSPDRLARNYVAHPSRPDHELLPDYHQRRYDAAHPR
jgi:site-specific DNA recombinase